MDVVETSDADRIKMAVALTSLSTSIRHHACPQPCHDENVHSMEEVDCTASDNCTAAVDRATKRMRHQ